MGNVYVTGHFQSTDARVNGSPLPNQGDYDIFVAKYDSDGNLLWIRTAGGKGYDYGHGIAVDSKGDVVVTGAFVGEAKFGEQTVSGSARPIFCAKYDSDGALKWVKASEGKASGSGHGIAVDARDNIYIGGLVSGAGAFGKLAVGSDQGQAALVLKLDANGEPQWAAVTPGAPSAGIHEIAADAQGRVWVAGMFKGKLSIGGESFNSGGEKDNDGFAVHYDASGKLVWVKSVHGPATDYCLGVATDGHGTGFITGEFSETATFAGQTLTSAGATDIYVAALDASGNLLWLKQAGGAKGDNAYTMAWHPSGVLVIGGACTAPATFGGAGLQASGGADLYGALLKAQ